jgi:FG-GAP-like repeat
MKLKQPLQQSLHANIQKFIIVSLTAAFLMITTIVTNAATFTVTTKSDAGIGSYRQALIDANSTAGTDTIDFNIEPGGIQTIRISLTQLPRISDSVIIDGTTQPGYTGSPIIELKGPGGFGSTAGITLEAGNSTIRGLVINNFADGGIGIYNFSGNNNNNLIVNNYIGTDTTGTIPASSGGNGIQLAGSSNNVIGGTTANLRNLISGNASGAGILISGNNNIIQGNYIGTDITGMIAMSNNGEGILIESTGGSSAANNLIGGSAPGAGNLISTNRRDEISISGSGANGNTIKGNLIGTNILGTARIPSPSGVLIGGLGISIIDGSNNIVGGTDSNSKNVISGNRFGDSGGGSGIFISRGSNNSVQGNFIGTDITGTLPIPNSDIGIAITDARNTIIGGVVPGAGNIIAFNGRDGVFIASSPNILTVGNSVRGNSIFSNTGIGIDLVGTRGVSVNDTCDSDTGPGVTNELQNYPVLLMAVRNGSVVTIQGNLNSVPNSTFSIDFYSSSSTDATGYGEGKTYIGTQNLSTDINCNGNFIYTLSYSGNAPFITATATDNNGNTSEFSKAIKIPTSVFDFDGDAKTDIAIYRPTLGQWWYLRSSDNANRAFQFGANGDKIVPADYTGDGKTDIATFTPSTGFWNILRSEDSTFYGFPFGANGDTAAPADYDGDGKADAAVFRTSNSTWFISKSSGGTTIQQFGTSGDKPTVADYDGDGKADLAIYRVALGQWWLVRSSDGTNRAFQFGTATDKPMQGDYTGDGKADLGFFRPSTGEWFILRSEDSTFYGFPFGASGDIPASGDYDGDGKFDAAVFRLSNTTWYLNRSTSGVGIIGFGASGDQPVPNAFVP